ncbi:MAG: hypothetical protein H7Z75_10525 [Ferruginibacter sp.]|nr:hypothetical protein [Cytophagales bacterium]
MKKDIPFLPVEGVQVAVAREKNGADAYEWRVFLINRNDAPLTNVLVTAKGYGTQPESLPGADRQQTSTLRHFFARIEPLGFALVELIDPAVFHLYSEYWVSYYRNEQVYDKKFIFVPGSIAEENLMPIAPLGMEGVLHE